MEPIHRHPPGLRAFPGIGMAAMSGLRPAVKGIRPRSILSRAAAFFAGACASVFAATEVCGTLSLAAEWTAKESPYLVTGDIFIPGNSRLRIGPGVIVRFAKPRPCPSDKDPYPQEDWADSA